MSGTTGGVRDRLAARAATVAVVGVTLAPFALDPFGFDRWVFAKELVLVLAALCALAARPVGRTPRWWPAWLGGALIVLAVAALLGAAPLAQLFGRWPRYEGLVSLGAYALAFWAGARLWGGRGVSETVRAARGRLFLATLGAAMTLTCAVAIVEAVGGRPIASDLVRPGALLGNASDLGVVGVIALAVLLPPTVAAWMARRERGMHRAAAALMVAGTVASVVVVVVSASRGALIASIVAVIASVAVGLRGPRAARRAWLGAGAAAIATGAVVMAASPLMLARITGEAAFAAGSAARRLDLWGDTAALVLERPLAGAGPSGFADAITGYLGETWFAAVGRGSWIESPHDIALQLVAAGGVIALLLAAAGLACAAYSLLRHGPGSVFGASGIIAIGAAAVALLTHLSSPGPMILLCAVAGATLARDPGAHRAPRSVRLIGATGLAAWAVVLVCALIADHAMGAGMSARDERERDAAFATAALLRPWDADIPLMVAEAFAAHADAESVVPAGAHDWAARATERLPASTRAWKATAVIAQYAGDLDGADAALRRAAELSPTDPDVFHRWGAVLLLNGRMRDALAALERAAGLNPDDADIRVTLEYARGLSA